ncbi:hypothetical protein CHS0354_020212 [Potamilus streckersoni]|uniref:AB hydrolase-1 domain-containing protein n=1 Tax=Potamilus streckersoni TaxID=2493646 RepID=A0AAE0VY27_9BIVA|nr:hypothetical protein CHS0354_020212 [Potamilus streckersoni]
MNQVKSVLFVTCTHIVLHIIFISGSLASGKDTNAELIEKEWQRLSEAGSTCPLKTLTSNELDNLLYNKQDENTLVCILMAFREDESKLSDSFMWSALGAVYQKLGLKSQANTCFEVATKLSGKVTTFIKTWNFIGPFVIGKMELDGDPLQAFGGIRNISKDRLVKGAHFYSELTPNGTVEWMIFNQKSAKDKVRIQPHINWNDLVSSLGSMGITEWQGWAIGVFAVNENEQNIIVQCIGVSTVYVDDVPLTGDVYHREQYWYGIKLERDIHTIFIRLRAKAVAEFKCELKVATNSFELLKPLFQPDLVDGYLFGPYLAVPISNHHNSQYLKILKVELHGHSSHSKEMTTTLEGEFNDIAPGQTMPINIKFRTRAKNHQLEKGCYDIEIQLKFITSDGSQILMLLLRCRKINEPFLFTFIDHDGSVQHGAAIKPTKNCPGNLCPVVLTLHGTTVSPQSQAESYKRMIGGEFVFGIKNCWLLAPTRHGAHNWEGPGLLTAMTAVSSLAKLSVDNKWMKDKVDPNHLIYAGHSMGGHGAWLLASHYPDKALAVISQAGWIKKEEYGDSNLFFRHDIATSHTDPSVKAVMEACIVENDVDRHVSNLKGIPVLARIGAKDRTVHPYFVKRMYRLLKEIGVQVNYNELEGKEHWWWDTNERNDGGVSNDKKIRKFIDRYTKGYFDPASYLKCNDDKGHCEAKQDESILEMPKTFLLTTYNPALSEGLHGIKITQQVTPFRLSTIKGENSKSLVSLTTSNVQRFTIGGYSNRKLIWKGKGIQVDKKFISPEVVSSVLSTSCSHFCHINGTWAVCQDCIETLGIRGPKTLGPARRIAENEFLIIIGTQSNSSVSLYLQQAAVYIANLFFLTSNTKAPILKDSDVDKSQFENRNLILLGGPQENLHTGQFLEKIPIGFKDGVTRIHNCEFNAERTGVMSLAPNGHHQLTMILMGNSLAGFQDIVTLATPTIPPMTRSPFSNLLPDFVITGPEFRQKGPGGMACIGFWGNSWEYRAYLSSCMCTS